MLLLKLQQRRLLSSSNITTPLLLLVFVLSSLRWTSCSATTTTAQPQRPPAGCGQSSVSVLWKKRTNVRFGIPSSFITHDNHYWNHRMTNVLLPVVVVSISRGGSNSSNDTSSSSNDHDAAASTTATTTTSTTDSINISTISSSSSSSSSNDGRDGAIAAETAVPTSAVMGNSPTRTGFSTHSDSSTTSFHSTAVTAATADTTKTDVDTAPAMVVVQRTMSDQWKQLMATTTSALASVRHQLQLQQVISNQLVHMSQYHTMIIAILLAMNSGYLNGLGLYGLTTIITTTSTTTTTNTIVSPSPPYAVAAVTGAYTNMGLQLAQGKLVSATIPFRFIVSYMFGSFLSGYILSGGNGGDSTMTTTTMMKPYDILTVPVSMIFGIGTIGLLLAVRLLQPSAMNNNSISMNIYYLLTVVNGLQNSFTSILSNNQIRSTHYSGMTSDTGTFLGQYLRHYPDRTELLPKISRNGILSLAFVIGSIVSYLLVQNLNIRYALLPCIVLYMTLTLISLLGKPKFTTPSTTSLTQ